MTPIRCAGIALVILLITGAAGARADAAQDPQTPTPPAGAAAGATRSSPWLFAPIVSSSPKLGSAFGVFGAYLKRFDKESRVSLFGATYQYTSTDSQVAALFSRASFGADHHRTVAIVALGYIKNDYEDYLGTGQPLKTDDDLKALVGRYLYRLKGNWFVGGQGIATNYQVLGESPEDDWILDSLGVTGFESAGVGAVVMHDSRDSEDMPTGGWFMNLNNLAYREALGGEASFDAYRADFRGFWGHGRGHVLAVRQFNWLTEGAPVAAQAAVMLRGYKVGEYLAPYMSSFEVEERVSLHRRWGATLFAGLAGLYGGDRTTTRDTYPVGGAGVHFVIKPDARMVLNFEYAQGFEDNRGLYLKFGYAW